MRQKQLLLRPTALESGGPGAAGGSRESQSTLCPLTAGSGPGR